MICSLLLPTSASLRLQNPLPIVSYRSNDYHTYRFPRLTVAFLQSANHEPLDAVLAQGPRLVVRVTVHAVRYIRREYGLLRDGVGLRRILDVS